MLVAEEGLDGRAAPASDDLCCPASGNQSDRRLTTSDVRTVCWLSFAGGKFTAGSEAGRSSSILPVPCKPAGGSTTRRLRCSYSPWSQARLLVTSGETDGRALVERKFVAVVVCQNADHIGKLVCTETTEPEHLVGAFFDLEVQNLVYASAERNKIGRGKKVNDSDCVDCSVVKLK